MKLILTQNDFVSRFFSIKYPSKLKLIAKGSKHEIDILNSILSKALTEYDTTVADEQYE